MTDAKRTQDVGFRSWQWGMPFALAFPKWKYSEWELKHLEIGWGKAERYHQRLEAEAAAHEEAIAEAVAIETRLEEAKKRLLEVFPSERGEVIITYIDALMEFRDAK